MSRRSRHAGARGAVAAAALVAAALTAGCNEELVVRVATRVFPDGSVSRRIELAGRTDKGQTPSAPDWLATDAGLSLVDPSVWRRVERAPARLSAEGVFASAADLPACLRHAGRDGLEPGVDRCATKLSVDDLVILKRYRYEEKWSDPIGSDAAARAMDRLFELAAEALREELHRQFGDAFDSGPAEAFARREARALADEGIAAARRLGRSPESELRAAWTAALRRRGVEAVETTERGKYWEAQVPGILAWSRRRVAEALSTPERTITPEDLSFWPTEDDLEESIRDIARRTWGDDKTVERQVESLVNAIQGWYSTTGMRYRFETRVALPGRVIATNGALEARVEGPADANAAIRFFRGEDLAAGDVVLSASSVTLDDEALRSLGARRELDARHLIEIVDLLSERDPSGLLAASLRRAVEKSRLDLLRGDETLPKDLAPLARELADQLDPAVEPPFG